MTTDTEVAGTYAMSGGSGDPSFVAERLGDIQDDRQAQAAEDIEAAAHDSELREHVETGDDPETVTIEVNSDTIVCRPLGLGERVRPLKMVTQGDERGDDALKASALIQMIDNLVEASLDDQYDQAYWDSLQDDPLRDAYRDLAEQSGGGNAPTR